MTERTTFTAYITKYALTRGILEREVEDCFHISSDMVSVVDAPWRESYHGNDWHRTREAAVDRAKTMRLLKLESLRKQTARIEKLVFA